MGSTSTKKQTQVPQNQEKAFIFKEMVKKNVQENPLTHYEFLQKVGEGNYAQVYKARSVSTGQLRVIKKVERKAGPAHNRHFFNEFDILREMDHPNIVKMYEMFEDDTHHYIVTEHLPGKDALDLLISLKHIKEDMAFNIFYHCLLALNNLHKNKVMHRDIKLENIIYDEETLCFKLIDFGSALRYASSSPKERRSTGTIHYMAPEVINKYYNMKCDVWSLGILLYVLLCGHAPFTGQNHGQILQKTLKDPLTFPNQIWSERSKEVKSLLIKMLDKNFERRPHIGDLMKQAWVLQHISLKRMSKVESEQICICLERMLKFRKVKMSDIQLGILLFMIHFIIKVDNEIAAIRSFLRIDTNGDGDIDEKQLRQALKEYLKMDCKTSEVAARDVISKIDLNGSRDISYSEYLLGATDLRVVITHQNISKAFHYIDSDNNGSLSMQELQSRLGDHLDEGQYKKLVCLFDSNGDGQIDLIEFSKMMKDLLNQY